MQPWIDAELKSVHLGDRRLDHRLHILLDRLSENPSLSIPAACHGRAETEAAYRLLGNDKVDADKILAPHADATVARARLYPVVLLVQDTTEIDLTRPRERVGGPLSDEYHYGLYDHATVAFTPQGLPLGVIDATIWGRRPELFRQSKQCGKKPIELKETFRWLDGFRTACSVAKTLDSTAVVSVSDSEGDIYECIAEATKTPSHVRAHWLTRACHDRRLEDEGSMLFAAVASAPVMGTAEVHVKERLKDRHDKRKRRTPRPSRTAKVSIQATQAVLRAPDCKKQLGPATVNCVLVREIAPPSGAVGIEWLLITDLPIDSRSDVDRIVDYYAVRWSIEVYFHVLKSGCRVEELQLETSERLTSCLALYMIVAWRVMYVTMLARVAGDTSSSAALEKDEWQALCALMHGGKVPSTAPTLREAVRMLAALGGYMGRSCDGEPGAKAVWIGLQRLKDIALGWQIANESNRRKGARN